MFLIFDLDDTLIDTSGSILPARMEEVLDALIKRGFVIKDRKKALLDLLRMSHNTMSSEKCLKEFIELHGGNEEMTLHAVKKLEEPLPENLEISLLPGANELLKNLSQSHTLFLVTRGNEAMQKQKWEKGGLQVSLFRKMVVTRGDKGKIYQELLEEFFLDPADVMVCADRAILDLKPAKELGMRTVQVLWGRGLSDRFSSKWTDHQVTQLEQIEDLIV